MLLEVPLEQAQHHILPPRDKTSEFEKILGARYSLLACAAVLFGEHLMTSDSIRQLNLADFLILAGF